MDLANLRVVFEADLAALQSGIGEGQSLLEGFKGQTETLARAEFTGDTAGLTTATDEGRGLLTSFKDEAMGLGSVEFRGDTAGLTAATGEARSELAGFKAESEGGANVMFTGDTAGISAAIGEAESELAGFRAAADEESHVMLTADTAGFNAGIGEAEATMGGFAASAGEMEAGAVGLGAAMGGVGESAGLMGGRMAEAEGATAAAGEEAVGAGERFEGLAGGVEGLAGGVESLAGTTGLLALAGAFGITGDEVLKSNIQFDKTSTALTTLTGDAASTQMQLEEIEKLGLEEGFSIPGLQKADQQLIATGMSAEEVVPTLKSIAEATVAVGTGQDGINAVVDGLQRMETTGTVTNRTILTLVKNGIPIYKELADVLGTDVTGAMDAIKNHTITADEVMEAMQENSGRLGDQMEAHASTFEGSVGRIAASIEALSTTAFRPLFDGLTGVGDGIANYLVGIASATSETDAFTAAFGPLAPVVQGAVAVFDAAYAGVTKFWSGVGSLISSLSPLGSALSPIIAQFQAWWPTIEPLVEEIAGPLSAGLIAVAAVLGGVMVASLVATVAGFVGITSTVALVAVAIGGAVVLFTSMYVAINNNATALSIWNTATSVARAGADLIIAGLTLLVQGALAVGTGINSAITWLNNFQGVLPILGSAASSAASAIGSAFSGAYNAVVNWLGQAVAYVRGWGASVVAAVSSVAAPIVAAVQAGWQRVVQITQTVLGPIATVIRYAFLLGEAAILLAYTVISSYVSAGWQRVVSLTQSVLAPVASFVSEIWNGLVSIISTALTTVEDWVSTGWQFVSDQTTSIWTAVQTFLQGWWDWLVGLVTPYVTNIETLIQTGWQYVSDQTTAIWTAVQSFLQTWWDWLVGLVTPYVQNIETLIQTGWQFISDQTNTIWTAIQSFLQSIWDNITSIFNTAVTGLETFLSDAWSSISSTATEGFHTIAHAIVDPMVDAVNTVMDVISSLGNWLADELDSWGVGASIASALRAGAPSHVANPLPFAEGGFRGAGEVNNQSFATGGASIANGTPGYTDQRVIEMGEALAPGEREYYLTESPQYKERNAGLWAEYGQRMGFAKGGTVESFAEGGISSPQDLEWDALKWLYGGFTGGVDSLADWYSGYGAGGTRESFATGGTSPDSVQNIFGGPGNADISQVANTGRGVTINPTHSFSATQSVNQSPGGVGGTGGTGGTGGAGGMAGAMGAPGAAGAPGSALPINSMTPLPGGGYVVDVTSGDATIPFTTASTGLTAGMYDLMPDTSGMVQEDTSGAQSTANSAGLMSDPLIPGGYYIDITQGGSAAPASGGAATPATSGVTPGTASGTTPGMASGAAPTSGATSGMPSATIPGASASPSGATAGGTSASSTPGKWYSTTGITSGMVPTKSLRWMPPPPSTSSTGASTGTTGTGTTGSTGSGAAGGGLFPNGLFGGSNTGTSTGASTGVGTTGAPSAGIGASGLGTSAPATGSAPPSAATSPDSLYTAAATGLPVGLYDIYPDTTGATAPDTTSPSSGSSPIGSGGLGGTTSAPGAAPGGGGRSVLSGTNSGTNTLNKTSGSPTSSNFANVSLTSNTTSQVHRFGLGGWVGNRGEGLGDTTYDWAPEMQGIVNREEANYATIANTYSGHGELGGSDEQDTADFWGMGGRGDPIDPGTGDAVLGDVWSGYSNDIMYYIWSGTEWRYDQGSMDASIYNGDDLHYDHVHVSLFPGGGAGGGGGALPSGAAGSGGTGVASARTSALNAGVSAITGGAAAALAPAGAVGQGLASLVTNVGKAAVTSIAPKLGGTIAGGAQAIGGDVSSLISQYFPADAQGMADMVVGRESGGDPSAQNPSGASGLFQIMPSTAEALGYDPSQLFDPAYNAMVAGALYQSQGWSPWSETAFADGGIVTSPVLGTIGEGGQDEAVIPLPAGATDFVEKMSHGSGDTSAIARQLADLKATVEKQHAMDRAHGTHITNTGQLAQMGAASAHAALASDAGKETMDKNISQSLGFFNNYLGDTV